MFHLYIEETQFMQSYHDITMIENSIKDIKNYVVLVKRLNRMISEQANARNIT